MSTSWIPSVGARVVYRASGEIGTVVNVMPHGVTVRWSDESRYGIVQVTDLEPERGTGSR